jgi:hypothetical protein
MDLALVDPDVAHDPAARQFAPVEGNINAAGDKKRLRHPAVLPEDAEAVQAVGATPEMDADPVHVPGVAGDPRQAVVHHAPDDQGQGDPDNQRDDDDHREGDGKLSRPGTDAGRGRMSWDRQGDRTIQPAPARQL